MSIMNSKPSSLRAAIHAASLGAVLAGCFAVNEAGAVDGTWTSDAAATWSDTTRWLGGVVADGTDAIADFSTIAITANRTVTIDGAVASRTVGTLLLSDTDATITPLHSWTIAASGGGTLTLATSAGTPTISVGVGLAGLPGVLNFTTITAPIVGTQGFVKNGPGAIRLNGDNSALSGPISVVEGTLRIGGTTNANALGSSSNTVTVSDGAQLYVNTVATFANNISISGYGVLEPDGATRLGALRFDQNGAELSGTITLTGDSGISARGAGAAGATVSGQITGAFALDLGRTSTTTGGGGSAVLIISNTANDWTGNTTIGDGTLMLGASGVIPNGTSAGDVFMRNEGVAHNPGIPNTVFDLNGFNETINGLSHTEGSDLTRLIVTNTGVTPAILTVGDNNANGVFGGVITGAISVTKIGTGSQTFSGMNTYTGDTIIEAGTLVLTINGALADTSSMHLNGGTLNLSFAGEDTIAGLFLAGAPQAFGTWGADGSGAQFTSEFITGTGILNVVPEPGAVALLVLGAGMGGLLYLRRRAERLNAWLS
jgi:autotransporter-associated beta strand protein